MPFVARKETIREECEKVVIHHLDDGGVIRAFVVEDDERPEERSGFIPEATVIYGIKKFRGRDNRRIADVMVTQDRKGKSKMLAGSVSRMKVLRGVEYIENVVDENDRPIEKMTESFYDERMGNDHINIVLAKINDLNGETSPEKVNEDDEKK